ncbi:hypothetical protein [Thermococcus sp. 21S9]|uniref:COG1470 family protein n=1 Tax=Thermococcus sp. 21S9 TaxID=1638223 RepID=UPI0014395149|nr:hypothetical protein [Thermococcus sp. 21S9]NJE54599.1 hypothetical protein [Thermococcus sp. 21S9]
MRKFVLLTTFLLGLLLIVGSSGNFRAYTASRSVEFGVVGGNDSYIAYRCLSDPVPVNASSGVEFTAITVENLMDRPITFHVAGNYSGLPDGLSGDVDSSTYTLDPGESVSIGGSFSADDDVEDGTYGVPLTVYAEWDGGSAQIKDCSMYASVERPTYVLKKAIVGDVYTYSLFAWNDITLQLNFTNNGPEGDFVIKDFIPNPGWKAVYVVGLPQPSSGNADLLLSVGHCGCSGWMIVWHVHVAHGETVTLNIPMGAVFFCKGDYVLNCGAHLCGADVVSNKITVHVTGGR